jgi:hypothetical protein
MLWRGASGPPLRLLHAARSAWCSSSSIEHAHSALFAWQVAMHPAMQLPGVRVTFLAVLGS